MPDTHPITALLLASLAPAGRDGALRGAAAAVPDWDAALKVAAVHRLAPHLTVRLRDAGLLAGLPAETRARLEQLYLLATVRETRLQAELLQILDAWRSARLAALPMRGPFLAQALGLPPATRQSDDLDFLLERTTLPQAQRILLNAGYAPMHAAPPAAAQRHLERVGEGLVLEKPGAGFQADLNWSLTARYFLPPITLDTLRPWIGERELGGQAPPELWPEALAVTLCVHGAKHLWSRHAWTRDVSALLWPSERVDWEKALVIAQQLRVERMLLLGVTWAARAAGLPAPPALAARAEADPDVRLLTDLLVARFATDPAWQPADDSTRARFQWRSQNGAARRTRYALWRLFVPTPNDWRALPLPELFFPLYAGLRPLRLAARITRISGSG